MTKLKAGERKYRKLQFTYDQLSGCCGIGVPYNFCEEEEYTWDLWGDGRRKKAPNRFVTREEQAQDCYQEILRARDAEDHTTLIISLVSRYEVGIKKGEAQFPELQDILIKEGWDINQVFINPNHGNEVTLFSKHFPEKVADYFDELNYEENAF